MLRNSLKTWARNFRRHKLFSLISLLGLTLGLSSCIYIYLWVQDETSYDTFHSNHEQLFRVEQQYFQEGLSEQWPITSGPFGSTLVTDYPEIEGFTRFWTKQYSVMDKDRTLHTQELFAVDNSIFELFDFHLEQGNENNALSEPKSVVLTRKLAIKYYGHDDVVGQNLTIMRGGEMEELKITGILEPVPENSHLRFEMLFSISEYSQYDFFKGWDGNFLYTYVKLTETANYEELESKFTSFLEKYKGRPGSLAEGETMDNYQKLRLNNIANIHLNPAIEWELGQQGNKVTVYIFSSIAILILIIAAINFTNLSIAKASKRSKEVGVRKSVGANRKQLIRQFLGESVLMSLAAAIASLLVVFMLLPKMNQISDKNISASQIFQSQQLLFLFIAAVVTGLVSGLYPAFYLVKFKAVEVLKGIRKGKSNSIFRTSLMTAQFVISIALIICTVTVSQQLEFVRTKSLGFDKENMIVISTVGFANQDYDAINSFKNNLLENPQIKGLCVSSNVSGDIQYGDRVYTLDRSEESLNITNVFVGYDFVDTYDIPLLSGRNFDRNYGTDTTGTIIINETAVKMLGLTPEDAIGRKLNNAVIVGVIDNFHYKSLKREIEPLVLILNPDQVNYLSVKLGAGDLSNVLAIVEGEYQELFSDQFAFTFLEDKLNTLYANDKKAHDLFIVFTSLSLILACMGLFGLAAFSAEERMKEMGVRKVLGASIKQITMLFLGEFTKWILISILVSWPLAYLFLRDWLSEFAFRTEIALSTFVLAAVFTAGIAILTILSQAVKMAKLNPVVTLKNE